jgi:hypothetical protein
LLDAAARRMDHNLSHSEKIKNIDFDNTIMTKIPE